MGMGASLNMGPSITGLGSSGMAAPPSVNMGFGNMGVSVSFGVPGMSPTPYTPDFLPPQPAYGMGGGFNLSIPVAENGVILNTHPNCTLRRRPSHVAGGIYNTGFRCNLCSQGNTPSRWCCEAHQYDVCETCLAAQLGITLRVPGGYM